jgi:hypothetical protein
VIRICWVAAPDPHRLIAHREQPDPSVQLTALFQLIERRLRTRCGAIQAPFAFVMAKDSRCPDLLSQPSRAPVPFKKLNHTELQRMQDECKGYAANGK